MIKLAADADCPADLIAGIAVAGQVVPQGRGAGTSIVVLAADIMDSAHDLRGAPSLVDAEVGHDVRPLRTFLQRGWADKPVEKVPPRSDDARLLR